VCSALCAVFVDDTTKDLAQFLAGHLGDVVVSHDVADSLPLLANAQLQSSLGVWLAEGVHDAHRCLDHVAAVNTGHHERQRRVADMLDEYAVDGLLVRRTSLGGEAGCYGDGYGTTLGRHHTVSYGRLTDGRSLWMDTDSLHPIHQAVAGTAYDSPVEVGPDTSS